MADDPDHGSRRRGQLPEGLLRVPLDALHRELGARMAGFAGYDMPIQYPTGLKTEHLRTRARPAACSTSRTWASCWSVRATAASRPCSRNWKPACRSTSTAGTPGVQKYSLLLNERGGIEDDLMLVNMGDEVRIIVNAGNRDHDLHLLTMRCPGLEFEWIDAALIALQGPQAEAVLSVLDPARRRRRASWKRPRSSCSARPASRPAPATPARTASRSRSRRSRPNWWCASCWRIRG